MLRVAIRMIAEDVEGGSTLSEAMGRHPRAFDRHPPVERRQE